MKGEEELTLEEKIERTFAPKYGYTYRHKEYDLNVSFYLDEESEDLALEVLAYYVKNSEKYFLMESSVKIKLKRKDFPKEESG